MSAQTKLELLGLIDGAVKDGWAHTQACRVLHLADDRAHRWRARLREAGTLEDRDPGGGAVHGLLSWEEQAILDLIETWGEVDLLAPQARAPRQLHRHRVREPVDGPARRLKNRVQLPGEPFRARPQSPHSRDFLGKQPDLDLGRDPLHPMQARRLRDRRCRHPLLDRLPRLERADPHSGAAAVRPGARRPGLLGPDGLPLRDDEEGPILVAWSDNGAEMTAIDTRQFMALMAITQHHGRPGTPTDQAHVESFFSHLKGDWPHLTGITDPAALDAELARIRTDYNTRRLHASIGYVTPDDEHHGRGPQIRRARAAGMRRARAERIKQNRASKK